MYEKSTITRRRTEFLPADWQSIVRARCKGKAVYRVTPKQRPTYNRLAALCGTLGKAARSEILVELAAAGTLPAELPRAFSVLGANEWVLFADSKMRTEATLTYAEVVAIVGAPS